MSIQDRIKQLNLLIQNDKNNVPKELRGRLSNYDSSKTIKPKDIKKDYKTEKVLLTEKKEKKDKKEKNDNNNSKFNEILNKQLEKSITVSNNNNIFDNIKKNSGNMPNIDNKKKENDKKEKDNKNQKMEISHTIAEKMKSLELYFKLRNEGLTKASTEGPKTLYIDNNNNMSIKTLDKAKFFAGEWVKEENETMVNLEIEKNAEEFNEDNYKERRYDKNNVESGKKFFKLRYIRNKLKQNISNPDKKQKDANNGEEEDKSLSQQNYDKERISRKYNSDFILIVEKSIISFNVKNYKESYEFLESSGIIKNVGEYGEFLLVVSGFDKFLIGEFLAKQKYPNDKKEVLNNFIESINMKKNETKFLDCLRFLFSRLILPKDANLILEIMDKFSINYFDTNKNDSNFVNIFKSSDKVYLLVSTILALNTMFTRKDIKIKNVIKKEEFIKMNADISKEFIDKLYDEIKKNPISMSDDYNESMYRKLAPLVKEDEGGNKNTNDDKQEEESNNYKYIERGSKGSDLQANEEDENDDDFFDDDIKKGIGKKEFSLKTNLQNFTEEDEKILKIPHKFYKINGSSKTSIREYVFSDDNTKILYEKKKFLITKQIIDVYNGINHNHNQNIKKYIKSNPSEEQYSGHFISLIFENDKDQVDLFSDDLDSALRWFKAIKSFILTYNNKKCKKRLIRR